MHTRQMAFVIRPSPELDASQVPDAVRGISQVSSELVFTIARVIETEPFRRPPGAALGRGYTIESSVPPATNVVHVRVHGPDAGVLRRFEVGYARLAGDWVKQAYPAYSLEFLEGKVAPDPAQRIAVERIGLAGLLGLLVGLLLLFADAKLVRREPPVGDGSGDGPPPGRGAAGAAAEAEGGAQHNGHAASSRSALRTWRSRPLLAPSSPPDWRRAAAVPVAAAAGVASVLAPAYTVAWIVAATAAVTAVVALRQPRLLLVVALAALVAYVPDVATAGTPVPALDLVLIAPAAVLVARRLLGEDHVTIPSEAAAFLALLVATTASCARGDRAGDRGRLDPADRRVRLPRRRHARAARPAGMAATGVLGRRRSPPRCSRRWRSSQQVTRTYDSDYFGLAHVMEDHGLERAAGPLDPNFFAMVLLASGALALYLGLSATTRGARLVAGATLGMVLAGAVTTSSRGGSIALGGCRAGDPRPQARAGVGGRGGRHRDARRRLCCSCRRG